MQNKQLSGSEKVQSIGVHASNNENSDSENDDYLLRASKTKDLTHPAKPLLQNESDVDVTILSNEESDEADFYMVTEANRQLHRQISQHPNFLRHDSIPRKPKYINFYGKTACPK